MTRLDCLQEYADLIDFRITQLSVDSDLKPIAGYEIEHEHLKEKLSLIAGIYRDICRIDNAPRGNDKEVLLEIIENTLEVSGSGSIEKVDDNRYKVLLFANRVTETRKGIELDISTIGRGFHIKDYKFLWCD